MDLITTIVLGPRHRIDQLENPMSQIIFDLLLEVDSWIFGLFFLEILKSKKR
jgi:hypothetical protein